MNIHQNYLRDEQSLVRSLIPLTRLESQQHQRITENARALVEQVRGDREHQSALDLMLGEYDLGSEEGVVLMCLAESFLRIPDSKTIDELIADKLGDIDWSTHLGNDDFFVNASTWGLMLTGKIVKRPSAEDGGLTAFVKGMLARLGEPLIRQAITQGMSIIAEQFVMGETVEEALRRSDKEGQDFECFSYDMLGEAALTNDDAERYFSAYQNAITTVGQHRNDSSDIAARGISVKLSALYPRFEVTHAAKAIIVLTDKLSQLVSLAEQHNVNITVDAEESDRLDMTLAIFAKVVRKHSLGGLGIAVQAYQKRALDVILWLAALAQQEQQKLRVRLVKGAYWDNEIKLAQGRGLTNYPVFTVKSHTDISYLACARALLEKDDHLDALFATHNAYTVAYIDQMTKQQPVEFQRLHGMGEALYRALNNAGPVRKCRVYAPVGEQRALLPYLIRRLLENGANTSFVHRIADATCDIESLIASPVDAAEADDCRPHPRIPSPKALFAPARVNSRGTNIGDPFELDELRVNVHAAAEQQFIATPIVNGEPGSGHTQVIHSPANPSKVVGEMILSDEHILDKALRIASDADVHLQWSAEQRAVILEQVADLLEKEQATLIAVAALECGRTILDSVDEVREAVDFCRYYASICRSQFGVAAQLAGKVGETNHIHWRPLGVFACISPWNFPISIYTGQIAGAFAAGNAVIAKPSELATLTAYQVTKIFLAAGMPASALGFAPGDGKDIGSRLVADTRIDGVVFTGATHTAQLIRKTLLERSGPPARFIAETGGVNAMIVDSSAMLEQAVIDVASSAVNSAGQRCSSLRALYVQEEVASDLLGMLCGHLDMLNIGDPLKLESDIGPVISAAARLHLEEYLESAKLNSRLLYRYPMSRDLKGNYFAPGIVAINDIAEIPVDMFGPIIHVRQFAADQLEQVCAEINRNNYALTCGIHSRIEQRIEFLSSRIRAGNIYINRNMIGAVVESQPFGGSRFSGSGPKAGGTDYLFGFATQCSVSDNVSAVGGNVSLLTMNE